MAFAGARWKKATAAPPGGGKGARRHQRGAEHDGVVHLHDLGEEGHLAARRASATAPRARTTVLRACARVVVYTFALCMLRFCVLRLRSAFGFRGLGSRVAAPV